MKTCENHLIRGSVPETNLFTATCRSLGICVADTPTPKN